MVGLAKISGRLSKGERVVDAETNALLNGIPNAALPGLVNGKSDGLAVLLEQANKNGGNMISLLKQLGYSYTRNGQTTIVRPQLGPESFIK